MKISVTAAAGVTLATAGKYCEENVAVIPVLQEKTVTPGKNPQTVTPDSGFAGLSGVTVEAVPEEEHFRRWTVTVAGDQTSYFTFLTDPWLQTHRADAELTVLIVPEFTVSGAYANTAILARNMPMQTRADGTTPNYQVVRTLNGTGDSIVSAATPKYPLTGNINATSHITVVTEDGQLQHRASASNVLKSGSYRVIAWV